MNIAKIFSEKPGNLPDEGFGFKKDAELFMDKEHTKLIGHKIEFNLPKNYIRVVPIDFDKQTDFGVCVLYGLPPATISYNQKEISKDIKEVLAKLSGQDVYTSSDFKDLETKLTSLRDFERKKANSIPIQKKNDTLIRHLIKNPETYSKPQSEWSFPIVYVGEKRVIVCAPTVDDYHY